MWWFKKEKGNPGYYEHELDRANKELLRQMAQVNQLEVKLELCSTELTGYKASYRDLLQRFSVLEKRVKEYESAEGLIEGFRMMVNALEAKEHH